MTKAKLKQLRDLLDELEEERQQFGRDAGVEVDDEEFANWTASAPDSGSMSAC